MPKQVTITIQNGAMMISPSSVMVPADRTINWTIVSDDDDWVFDGAGIVIAGNTDLPAGVDANFIGWPDDQQQPSRVADSNLKQYTSLIPLPPPDKPAAKYRYTINVVHATRKSKIKWDPDIENHP
jgi:hypothetical protein